MRGTQFQNQIISTQYGVSAEFSPKTIALPEGMNISGLCRSVTPGSRSTECWEWACRGYLRSLRKCIFQTVSPTGQKGKLRPSAPITRRSVMTPFTSGKFRLCGHKSWQVTMAIPCFISPREAWGGCWAARNTGLRQIPAQVPQTTWVLSFLLSTGWTSRWSRENTEMPNILQVLKSRVI